MISKNTFRDFPSFKECIQFILCFIIGVPTVLLILLLIVGGIRRFVMMLEHSPGFIHFVKTILGV